MPRAIGLMSGTSLDGVDAALLDTDGERIFGFGPARTLPYPDDLRQQLRQLLDLAPGLAADDRRVLDAERRLTIYHADAVAALREPADIIGFHGQTILHRPVEGLTWQIGDASLLASLTGTPVVSDFRGADVAAGGQGAPLVPVFHAALAANLPKPVALLNIGGVANVTWIGAEGELLAFDTGPGNGPLDDWAKRHTGAPVDQDGKLAMSGTADTNVLARLLQAPFFAQSAPKSLDRLDFGRLLATSGLEQLSPADGAATLVAFVAASVAASRFPATPLQWLVCGGGRHNPALMTALRQTLPNRVEPVETKGWDGDAVEAQCFAYLAVRSLRGLPLSFPGTTGVPGPQAGGRLSEPPGVRVNAA